MKKEENGDEVMEHKTNVMRILERYKITYTAYCYKDKGVTSGVDVARAMEQPAERVFKTLVAVGKSRKYYVFVVPVEQELDLKKAAAAAGEKSVSMLPQKELLGLTGYVHGGCSPIGMKKQFQTFLDSSAESRETIIFSAGQVGYQVELAPGQLPKALVFQTADLTIS